MAVMFLAQPGCCRCLSLTARTYTQQMLLNCPGKEAAGLMEKEVHIFLGKKSWISTRQGEARSLSATYSRKKEISTHRGKLTLKWFPGQF